MEKETLEAPMSQQEYLAYSEEVTKRYNDSSELFAKAIMGIVETKNKPQELPQEVFDWLVENGDQIKDRLSADDKKWVFHNGDTLTLNGTINFPDRLELDMIIGGNYVNDIKRGEAWGKTSMENFESDIINADAQLKNILEEFPLSE